MPAMPFFATTTVKVSHKVIFPTLSQIDTLKNKINNIFLRKDKENIFRDQALLNDLIDVCIKEGIEEGKKHGRVKEKIVYAGSSQEWDREKVYPRSEAYQGD